MHGMSQLATQAFQQLYPGKRLSRQFSIRYSGRFKGLNANVQMSSEEVTFSLSRAYQEVSEEIRIGVMQHLLNKLHKTKVQTLEIELYNKYVQKLSDHAPVTDVDPFLEKHFEQLNDQYFNGFMTLPNLKWGSYSLRKLGHYEFDSDTIVLSTALKEDLDLLDFVLYHEMLHKKHKFTCSGSQTRSHTAAFRKDERKFHIKDIEQKLERFVHSRKRLQKRTKLPTLRELFRYL